MDYAKWFDCDWEDYKKYEEFQEELVSDLTTQLEAQGLILLKLLPNRYFFGAIAASPDETKLVHVTIEDVRSGKNWYEKACMRRMSSTRDWKGEHYHFTSWPQVGTLTKEIMGEAYDSEIL